MGNERFEHLCKQLVMFQYNKYLKRRKDPELTEENIYIVWMCKTLQNNKALVSTTVDDGRYYEVTYNGDEDEMYLDVYQNQENVVLNTDGGDIHEEDHFCTVRDRADHDAAGHCAGRGRRDCR